MQMKLYKTVIQHSKISINTSYVILVVTEEIMKTHSHTNSNNTNNNNNNVCLHCDKCFMNFSCQRFII